MINWIKSKNGAKVPVVNGMSLCSSIDPNKEGKKWVDANQELIKDFEYIFILGIAGGFHVEEAQKLNPKAFITVIENNAELAAAFEFSFNHQVSILSAPTVEEIKNYESFFSIFEQGSYCVLTHPASIAQDLKYYRKIQDFILGRNKEGLTYLSKIKARQNPYFENFTLNHNLGGTESVVEIADRIREWDAEYTEEDLIWLSLGELVH